METEIQDVRRAWYQNGTTLSVLEPCTSLHGRGVEVSWNNSQKGSRNRDRIERYWLKFARKEAANTREQSLINLPVMRLVTVETIITGCSRFLLDNKGEMTSAHSSPDIETEERKQATQKWNWRLLWKNLVTPSARPSGGHIYFRSQKIFGHFSHTWKCMMSLRIITKYQTKWQL